MKRKSDFFRTMFRLLKMIHAQDRDIIPLYMIDAVVQALSPFIVIVGGARILDLLLGERWEDALLLAAVMIVFSAAAGILSRYLSAKRESRSMMINRLCNISISLKAMELDYETFADKRNLEEYAAADYNVSQNGGFGSYMLNMSIFLTGLVRLIAALAILIDLCLKRTADGIKGGFLLSPAGSLVLLTAAICLLGVLYAKISDYTDRENLKLWERMNETYQKLSFFEDELFFDEEYAKEIRMYGMQDMLYQEWKKMTIDAHALCYQRSMDVNRFSGQAASLLKSGLVLAAYLFVVAKTWAGAVTVGLFTQYVNAVSQMNEGLRKMIEALNSIRVMHTYLSFYTGFLEKKNRMDMGSLPVEKRNDNQFEIEFHDVSFRYPGTQEDVLKHINVKLDMKKHFAVVGRNGAGKTTFIKLLCRMYDVTEGSITLNDVDIRKYDHREYMNLFATVFQDFTLFAISVRDNVACSAATDEKRLWDALECAGIGERIRELPDGADTRLYHEMGEGVDISGGEAQKIAIARALYKDAPYVILDEPTAALDPISEYEIYARFDEMVKEKTSIYISHRMSSCRFCDDILVFDQGSLVQRGSHEMLIRDEDNVYARLWNAQAQYYAEIF